MATLSDLTRDLPPPWPRELLPAIRSELNHRPRTVVALDDDPTGTQTVYDLPVLTEWSFESLAAEIGAKTPLFYILTNSRTLRQREAIRVAREIGGRLERAAGAAGRAVTAISRSDSTLRGHYPSEVDGLAAALGLADAVHVIAPCFFEGGRYTLEDVHYVAEGEIMRPAGDTPFARDATFGYTASNLREWIVEKTEGRIPLERIGSLSLERLRSEGPVAAAQQLLSAEPGGACVVNAACERDLECAVLGALLAERRGGRFLYRTAASFVRTYAGLAPRPPLDPECLADEINGPGLVVVGSYVPKSTAQLKILLERSGSSSVEIRVDALLSGSEKGAEIGRVTAATRKALENGRDVVLYTSRELVRAATAEKSLEIVRRVSGGIVEIAGQLPKPGFVIGKGGITSSDLLTRCCGVRRGWILGQLLPGVPILKCGPESRCPGMLFVIFPGNVGDDHALFEAMRRLTGVPG